MRVQEVLGIDDLAYGTFQYTQGMLYMKDKLKLTPSQLDAMSRSKSYWKWWVNQWDLLDAYTFLPALPDLHKDNIYDAYLNLHHPDFLVGTVEQKAWEEFYATMADEMIEELKRQENRIQ